MKKTYLLTLALLSVYVLAACAGSHSVESTARSSLTTSAETGKLKERTYTLKNFDGIDATGRATIYFTQGKDYKVVVRGTRRDLDDCILQVDNHTLTLDWKSRNTWNSDDPHLLLYVTAPSLRNLELKGAVKITASELTTDELEIDATGAAEVAIERLRCKREFSTECKGAARLVVDDVRCGCFTAENYGAVTLKMNVKADETVLESSGAGNQQFTVTSDRMTLKNTGAVKSDISFKGKQLSLNESGATNTSVKVDCDRLRASVTGASNVVVSGTADDTDFNVTGMAKLITTDLNKF